ncbi:MAG: mycothiol system anti-sigma-R factor [Actinomycetota bacterium]
MSESDCGCRELLEGLYALLDEELPPGPCAELKAHLLRCGECLERYGVEQDFKELVRHRCAEQQVPAALLDRIRGALGLEAARPE